MLHISSSVRQRKAVETTINNDGADGKDDIFTKEFTVAEASNAAVKSNTGDRHKNFPQEINVSGRATFKPEVSAAVDFSSGTPSAAPTTLSAIPRAMSTSPTAIVSRSSSAPSRKPSLEPTSSSSSAPSHWPSLAPTFLPTISPVANVSSDEPSAAPSAPPTVDCNADISGSWGIQSNVALSVEYLYEIELNPSLLVNKSVEHDILPAVERAIIDKLISVLVDSKCGNDSRQRRRKILAGRRLEIVGARTSPDEIVFHELSCQVQLAHTENECDVVAASLTLYVIGTESEEKTTALSAIKEGMDNDEFVHADEAIISLTFIEIHPQGYEIEDTNTRATDGTESIDRNNLPVILIAAGAAFFFILLLLFLRRRQKDKNDADDDSLENNSQDEIIAQSVLRSDEYSASDDETLRLAESMQFSGGL